MAKKIFASLAIMFLLLCCSVCFAAENNSNVNLGNQITDSLDKAGNSVRNATDNVMDAGENTLRSMGNVMTDDNRNNNTANARNNRTDYNAVRTSVDETANTAMSTTTWIWIILAVAAIVIVAMVWYYAIQDNNRN